MQFVLYGDCCSGVPGPPRWRPGDGTAGYTWTFLGTKRWHNRLLYDQAEAVARAAVAVVNADFGAVYVLGDVTESRTDPQLELAWAGVIAGAVVCVARQPHRAAVRSGQFEAVYVNRVLPPSAVHGGIAVAVLGEKSAEPDGAARLPGVSTPKRLIKEA